MFLDCNIPYGLICREVSVLLLQRQVPGGYPEESAGAERALCSYTLLGLQRTHSDNRSGKH